MVRVPPFDRGQAPGVDSGLDLCESDSLQIDRWAGLWHRTSLDCFVIRLKAGAHDEFDFSPIGDRHRRQ